MRLLFIVCACPLQYCDICNCVTLLHCRSVWIKVSSLDALRGCNLGATPNMQTDFWSKYYAAARITLQLNEAFPGQVFKVSNSHSTATHCTSYNPKPLANNTYFIP